VSGGRAVLAVCAHAPSPPSPFPPSPFPPSPFSLPYLPFPSHSTTPFPHNRKVSATGPRLSPAGKTFTFSRSDPQLPQLPLPHTSTSFVLHNIVFFSLFLYPMYRRYFAFFLACTFLLGVFCVSVCLIALMFLFAPPPIPLKLFLLLLTFL